LAALETAVKEFARNAVPLASWLVENLQSPPVVRLLNEYLPSLHSKANGFQHIPAPSKQILIHLEATVKARNAIVHGKVVKLSSIHVEKTLRMIFELLYFLDYHAGCSWAETIIPGS